MRLVSFNHRGRQGYGVVIGDGIVDIHARLPRYHTLLDMLRDGALDVVRAAAADVRPDFPLAEVELLKANAGSGD